MHQTFFNILIIVISKSKNVLKVFIYYYYLNFKSNQNSIFYFVITMYLNTDI